jgi:hypothetical protein
VESHLETVDFMDVRIPGICWFVIAETNIYCVEGICIDEEKVIAEILTIDDFGGPCFACKFMRHSKI